MIVYEVDYLRQQVQDLTKEVSRCRAMVKLSQESATHWEHRYNLLCNKLQEEAS